MMPFVSFDRIASSEDSTIEARYPACGTDFLRSFISPGRGLEQLLADAKRVPSPFWARRTHGDDTERTLGRARCAAIPRFAMYLFDSARAATIASATARWF